jgi:hypothetical protein
MSGLLFLFTVAGFVLIAYWAYRNDAMGLQESGSGLLAMSMAAAKPKPLPKWKKSGPAEIEAPRRSKAAGNAKPGWKRTLLYGSVR